MGKATASSSSEQWYLKVLGKIERIGNKLPEPGLLFVYCILVTWLLSWLLAGTEFSIPAKSGDISKTVQNQLTPQNLLDFFANSVQTFINFKPLGIVIVAMMGLAVAEHAGFIKAALKKVLDRTPKALITPLVLFVGIMSNIGVDAGYALVIPLGAIIFAAAGRHPLAGLACAFAGVSGGFGANLLPSAVEPLLSGITQEAVGIIDPNRPVNPLCNWWFMIVGTFFIMFSGWWVTDKIVEPRLKKAAKVDIDPEDVPKVDKLTKKEEKGLFWSLLSMLVIAVGVFLICLPEDSLLRDASGSLQSFKAPIMKMIVPLIFIGFFVPAVIHGYVSGKFTHHRDVMAGLEKGVSTLSSYIVIAFFTALFVYTFSQSSIGAWLSFQGAEILKSLNLPGGFTIVGLIAVCATANLFIGSMSAKWAMMAPILVPMLMQVGISPELTQAAYRVGDSSTNIISPLMTLFPVIFAFARKWCSKTGIGSMISMMMPYSIVFITGWSLLLVLFWVLGIPLGIQGFLTY